MARVDSEIKVSHGKRGEEKQSFFGKYVNLFQQIRIKAGD